MGSRVICEIKSVSGKRVVSSLSFSPLSYPGHCDSKLAFEFFFPGMGVMMKL